MHLIALRHSVLPLLIVVVELHAKLFGSVAEGLVVRKTEQLRRLLFLVTAFLKSPPEVMARHVIQQHLQIKPLPERSIEYARIDTAYVD